MSNVNNVKTFPKQHSNQITVSMENFEESHGCKVALPLGHGKPIIIMIKTTVIQERYRGYKSKPIQFCLLSVAMLDGSICQIF